MKTKILFSAVLIVLAPCVGFAQSASTPTVITGTDNTGFPITSPVGTGSNGSVPMPVSATFTPSGTQNVTGTGTAGTPATGVVTVQGISGGTNLPVQTNPGVRVPIALDIATVTTGGTAVTALNAGHAIAGGFLSNPKGATIDLCYNQLATASGTTTAGSLICIPPGGSANLIPSASAVSVITSDSTHLFGGYGAQ